MQVEVLTLVETAALPSLMGMGRELVHGCPPGLWGHCLQGGEEPSAENMLEPKWNVLGEASKWSLWEKLWKISSGKNGEEPDEQVG